MALSHAQYIYIKELKQSLQRELETYVAKRDKLLEAKRSHDELGQAALDKDALFDAIETATPETKAFLREQRMALKSQVDQHRKRSSELNDHIKIARAEVENTRNRLSIFDLPALKNELKSYERLHAR